MTTTSVSTSGTEGGWLNAIEQASAEQKGQTTHELWQLHGSMTDPFASLGRRLEATLQSYQYSTEARSLIEWAVAQTGLDDPLTKYTRQELEQAFPRFARDRELHLKDLVRTLKRNGDHATLKKIKDSVPPPARTALAKAVAG